MMSPQPRQLSTPAQEPLTERKAPTTDSLWPSHTGQLPSHRPSSVTEPPGVVQQEGPKSSFSWLPSPFLSWSGSSGLFFLSKSETLILRGSAMYSICPHLGPVL